jgi:hypothetical protein
LYRPFRLILGKSKVRNLVQNWFTLISNEWRKTLVVFYANDLFDLIDNLFLSDVIEVTQKAKMDFI